MNEGVVVGVDVVGVGCVVFGCCVEIGLGVGCC